MEPPSQPRLVYRFGLFQLDPEDGTLLHKGLPVKIQDQPFQVLCQLLRHPNKIVSREELRKSLWPSGTYVEFEGSLNAALKRLRYALGDDADNPVFIETIPKRGYRFIAPVECGPCSESAAVPITHGAPGGSSRFKYYAAALGIALSGLVALVVLTHLHLRAVQTPRAPAPPSRIMLAVLPFDNFTGDPKNEYFSDGLTEELITQVAELQPDRLGVIARTSVMAYKHGDRSISRVGRQLGVQYIVEGSLRQSSGRVRITAQLIQVRDQTHLWAEDYDRELGDMLNMEREVSTSIARQIQIELTPQQRAQLIQRRKIDPEAHELYLKGLFCWNQRTDNGYRKAIDFFNAAIARDPNYAEAYAGLANAYNFLADDLPPEQGKPKARAAAEAALALNPNLAEAHAALGLVNDDGNWDELREHLQRAIELNPNSAIAHDWYAEGYLTPMGRLDDSLAELRVAQQLDPLSLVVVTDNGKTLYFARRYDQAVAQLQSVLDMNPNFLPATIWLGQAYVEKGMYPQALNIVERERRVVPRTQYLAELAYVDARMGDSGESRQLLQQVLKLSHSEYADPGPIARIYAGLGDKAQALLWLEMAIAAHSTYAYGVKVSPWCDPLRNDPRFIDIERRAKLIP